MTKFNFVDFNHHIEINIKTYNSTFEDIDLKSLIVNQSKVIINHKLTVYLEDTLVFMQNNNLLPELPETINIKYINISSKEILITKLKDIFGLKPFQYNSPASTNIADGTIYISNYYYQENFNNDKHIENIRKQFNNDIQQSLEYSFFHELGHLFLIEKNADKINTQNDELSKILRLNIEEGFAEAFATHMICLKYPEIEVETQNFKYFQKKTVQLSKDIENLFSNIKKLEINSSSHNFLKISINRDCIKTHEMFDPYEFPLIYTSSPFKDNDGQLINDMNIIFEKCFESALKNNKTVVLNKNFFIKEFSVDLMVNLQKSSNNISSNLEQLIDNFHLAVKNDGFLTKRIKSMRDNHFNQRFYFNKNNI